MMQKLGRKLSTSWRLLTTQGIGAIWHKIRSNIIGWWTSDHWWLGRIVELRGNMALLDGCRFDLSSPVIKTPQKAGFLLGNYEYGERAALRHIPVSPPLPIVEFGGSIGAMACVSSKHFGNPEQHVVVEANPNLIPVLTRNRDLNECRFQLIPAALAYNTDRIAFHIGTKFIEGSLYHQSEHGQTVEVPTISLGDILEQHNFQGSIVLFCDIEGAETALFAHEAELLATRVKHLCIEFHPTLSGRSTVETMIDQLRSMGFRLVYQHKDNYLYINENL
jgi:FkbM family methyltransferase